MKKSKAFSLIELSIVIVIIGILVAGVTNGSRLIKAYRVSNASTLTNSSPAHSISGMRFWYDATREENFATGETNNGTVITTWKDCNSQSNLKIDASSPTPTSTADGPTYILNGINGLPTLRFTNTISKGIYLNVSSSLTTANFSSLTAFMVINYRSGSGYFFDRVPGSVPLFSAQVTNSSGNYLHMITRDDSNNFYDSGLTFSIVPGKNYIVTLSKVYSKRLAMYVNGGGTSAGGITITNTSSPILTNSLTLPQLRIGKVGSNGFETTDIDISEILFYEGTMAVDDMDAIETYLGKKYGIPVSNN